MKIKRLLLAVAVLLFSSSLFFGTLGSAQEGGSGIRISPTRTELSVLPGESKTFKINLKNITPGVIIAEAYINDFKSDNETGTPQIIVDPNERSDRSIQPFLKGLRNLELQPGESRDVELTVDVPADAPPGGYYGALRFAAIPKDRVLGQQEREIALTASVAHLAFLQIPGDVTEGISYDKLEVLKGGTSGSFFTSPPDETLSVITNTGNSLVQPFGRVFVKKGDKEVYSFEFNFENKNRGTILPKSSRTFKNGLQNIGSFGKYEIVSSISYKQGGEVITNKKTFWVIPVWMIALVAILFLGLVIGVLYLRFGGKTKKSKR